MKGLDALIGRKAIVSVVTPAGGTPHVSSMEFLPADRAPSITLDEAFSLAKRYGKPTIGPSFSGTNAAELHLDEDSGGAHYITLRCKKFDTAAENLIYCCQLAEKIKGVVR